MLMPRNIVRGQQINRGLLTYARRMRKQPTPQEKIVWDQLRANKLGVHFRRQQVVAGAIVDFYCHSAALVIKIDGSVHEKLKPFDRVRDLNLERQGFRTIRFTNDEVESDLASVMARIQIALKPNPLAPFPGREGGTEKK